MYLEVVIFLASCTANYSLLLLRRRAKVEFAASTDSKIIRTKPIRFFFAFFVAASLAHIFQIFEQFFEMNFSIFPPPYGEANVNSSKIDDLQVDAPNRESKFHAAGGPDWILEICGVKF